MNIFRTISPVDGRIYFEREYDSADEVNYCLDKALHAQTKWQSLSIKARAEKMHKFVDYIVSKKRDIAQEISLQVGRPIAQSSGEISGFEERARYMIDIAEESLKDYRPKEKDGFERWIEREPLGVVCALSPWNYPYLTSVNSIVPALMAGNVVILKHSAQTPMTTKRYLEAAEFATFPDGVFQGVYLNHEDTSNMIADDRVDGVFFTGSVEGGKSVQKSLNNKFIPCGLELGGKDAAYVRADVDVSFAAENLVDGAFFNSGQSCCGIERIYVHKDVYDLFINKFVAITKQYKLGSPLELETTIGPMVKSSAADRLRKQIKDALEQGAKALIDEKAFAESKPNTPYLAPQVLVDVNHQMDVMREESFGPVVGIMKVEDDGQALELINDSQYGLTASVWTKDVDSAKNIARKVKAGTVYLNRCDYLDPALAWTGVNNSGRGVTLSSLGYDHVTKFKSFHFKTQV